VRWTDDSITLRTGRFEVIDEWRKVIRVLQHALNDEVD
jgi:hypothetical protein